VINPVLLSAAFGFLKGAMSEGELAYPVSKSYAFFGAPAIEEAAYRALPFETARAAGLALPGGSTAVAFALDHVLNERNGTPGETALRFADVFAGGLLYEIAYKQFGFLGAVLSHVAHNVMISVGKSARGGYGY
jgi:membrane protease YdiL (CAAX protease family)